MSAFLTGITAADPTAEIVLATPATAEAIGRVHPAGYLDALDAACATAGMLDRDTFATPASPAAARASAGAAIDAVAAALAGEQAIAAARPPGHHALPDRPMGFCLLANGAIAVRAAQARHDVGKVAIVDWDVHHGNGTQAVFEADPTVLAVSLHELPWWPYSGSADERGSGAGRGTTLNVPIAAGTDHAAYLETFRAVVLPAVEAFAPELIVIACGLDAHRLDPLANLELEDETFADLLLELRRLARSLAIPEPPLILEGGYDLEALRGSAAALARAYSSSI